MKYARIIEDRDGYWKVKCDDSGNQIGQACYSELEAYKMANGHGYLVK